MREQRATHVPPRASRTTDQYFPPPADDEDDDSYYAERLPTSARRYIDTRGNQVIQQGNKRIVLHKEPPSKKRSTHWLVYVGLGMLAMLLLWAGLSWLIHWWTMHQLDSLYG